MVAVGAVDDESVDFAGADGAQGGFEFFETEAGGPKHALGAGRILVSACVLVFFS